MRYCSRKFAAKFTLHGLINFTSVVGLFYAVISPSIGCVASFSQHQIASVGEISVKDSAGYKPSVLLDVSFYFDVGSRFDVHPRNRAFKGIVARVSDNSGMFSSYTMVKPEAREFEYAIKMKLVNHGSMNATIAAGVITGASLGLIPTSVTDRFTLTATVTDKNNKELKAYEINDAIRSWLGFWSFFPSDESAERKVSYDVWENMVKNLYQQIQEDGLLSRRP